MASQVTQTKKTWLKRPVGQSDFPVSQSDINRLHNVSVEHIQPDKRRVGLGSCNLSTIPATL